MKPNRFQKHRINVVLLAQYPDLDLSTVLGNLDITVSRKTKRIKEIFNVDNDNKILLFSLRTNDGRFLPTFEGGKRIINTGYQKYLVKVTDEAAPYVRRGKSTFCKHVIEADENIVPVSEVFVIDENNDLLAIGSSIQPAYAMLQLKAGIAVKIRTFQK